MWKGREKGKEMKIKDRKKAEGASILGVAAALLLLVGCKGQGIPKQADSDTALQLQQNIKEESTADEILPEQSGQPEQSEEPEQSGQPERTAQLKETERLSEEEPDDRGQNELDTDRIIEEQSFQVELNDWGEVRFLSYEPDSSKKDLLEDVTFYLSKNEEILYQFPYISENRTSGYGYYWDVKFVLFTDTNGDGKQDVVIGPEYMTGIGPQGAVPHVAVRIYEDYGDCFIYNGELSDKVNGYLPWESNVLAKDVRRLLQLINGNEPLTNYESYTGNWTVGPGYVAAYENPMPESGNRLTSSISNGNEFYGTLFTEQGTTGLIASVENIAGTIQNGELFYEFTDDGSGCAGTLHITFLPNQINVEVLNHKIAEENVIGYGVSGNYEMTIRE